MKRSAWLVVVVVCVVVSALLLAPGVPSVTLAAAEPCEQLANGMLVQVHGVRSGQGSLIAVLYGDKPEEFLKKGARVARERTPARCRRSATPTS